MELKLYKTVVVFSGRFQPFHQGHFSAYKQLCTAFREADIWIATSDKTGTNSPLNFENRKAVIVSAGVPERNVVLVKNPYKAEEIITQYNPLIDKLIFAIGQKDCERISFAVKKDGTPSYLQPFINEKSMLAFNKHAYVYVMPTIEFQFNGKNISSASEIRRELGSNIESLSTFAS